MNQRKIIIIGLILITFGIKSFSQNGMVKADNDYIIKSYLSTSLWEKRDIYDAGHFLMVPLHYSFIKKDEDLKLSFTNFFEMFLCSYKQSYVNNHNNLQRLQFSYLISQYLKLHLKYDSRNYTNFEYKLLNFLKEEINYFWTEAKANNWKYSAFIKYQFIGFKDRINWKLNTRLHDDLDFYRAIIDEEKFLIAIASDLKFIYRKNNKEILTNNEINQIDSIVKIGFNIFYNRVSPKFDEFVFQKGFWSKHRDFKYAGCETIKCIDAGANRISNISEDTSHSLRLPLLIRSLEDGVELIENKKYFATLRGKLISQLLNKVIQKKENSNCFYPTNYLDGNNGYYRYNYETHKNEGYGPYELSETFKLGWWAFLDDKRISRLYKKISSNLKNKRSCEFIYKDKTKRERHPIIVNRFNNNLYLLITSMSSELLLIGK